MHSYSVGCYDTIHKRHTNSIYLYPSYSKPSPRPNINPISSIFTFNQYLACQRQRNYGLVLKSLLKLHERQTADKLFQSISSAD